MTYALATLTRYEANEILRRWKAGVEQYPPELIRLALYRTGDLASLR